MDLKELIKEWKEYKKRCDDEFSKPLSVIPDFFVLATFEGFMNYLTRKYEE